MIMVFRYLTLLIIFGCVSKVLCSCEAQSEPAAPQEATSCGCENLKRAAAAVDGAEEQTASILSDTAGKYSRGVNEKVSETHGDEKVLQSQVIYHCYQVKTEIFTFLNIYNEQKEMGHRKIATMNSQPLGLACLVNCICLRTEW